MSKVKFANSFFESLEKLGMNDEEKEQLIAELQEQFENDFDKIEIISREVSPEELEELGIDDEELDKPERIIQ